MNILSIDFLLALLLRGTALLLNKLSEIYVRVRFRRKETRAIEEN